MKSEAHITYANSKLNFIGVIILELSRSKILLIRFHGSVFYSASFRWRFHSPQATSMS